MAHGLHFLGLTFSKQLHWKSHIEKISNRFSKTLSILNRLKRLLPLNIKILLYNSLILPHLNNGITACGYKCESIKKLQKKVVRNISVSKKNYQTEPLLKSLNLLKIEHIITFQELKIYYTLTNNKLPVYLQHLSQGNTTGTQSENNTNL